MLKFILGLTVGLGFALFGDYGMSVLQRILECIQ